MECDKSMIKYNSSIDLLEYYCIYINISHLSQFEKIEKKKSKITRPIFFFYKGLKRIE